MNTVHPNFQHNEFLFRKKVFKIFGGAFHIYDKNGNVVFYSKQKAFKLKEDFRIYTSEDMSQEILNIKTPQILDIAATYHVEDSSTKEFVGSLKRKGIKSIFKDEWLFLSKDGQEIGKLAETGWSAFLSRFINIIPQKYIILSSTETEIAELKQHFNPFVLKYSLTFKNPTPSIDKRLIIAAGILLLSIEGRQQ